MESYIYIYILYLWNWTNTNRQSFSRYFLAFSVWLFPRGTITGFCPAVPIGTVQWKWQKNLQQKKNLIKSKTLRSTPYLRHIQFSKSSQCLLFVCRSIGGESKNLCNIVKNLYCFMSIASVFFCYAHKGQTQVFKHPTTNRLHFVSFQMLRN